MPQNILKRLESPLDAEETTCEPQSISVLHIRVAPNMASEVLNDLLSEMLVIYFLAFSKRGVTDTLRAIEVWDYLRENRTMVADDSRLCVPCSGTMPSHSP